jgi:hypothetical protein
MPIALWRLRQPGIVALILINALVALALILTGWLLWLERGWVVQPQVREAQDAFQHGTIGTELMPGGLGDPAKLDDPPTQDFLPRGRAAGDWIDQFGFLRSEPRANQGLPVGFVVSNYRPASASPSPVPFVGFSCALCHTTELRDAGGHSTGQILGPGSVSLSLFSWIDAFQSAMIEREKSPASDREGDQAGAHCLGPFEEGSVLFSWACDALPTLAADNGPPPPYRVTTELIASPAVSNLAHLFWTFAYLTFLVRAVWAIFIVFHGVADTFREMGLFIAGMNSLLLLWWGLEVVLLWSVRIRSRLLAIFQVATRVFVFLVFALTLLFLRATGPVRALGVVFVAITLVALAIRFWARGGAERPGWLAETGALT